ncbi:hypothetical protein FAES_pFAES01070 (plasmid) [Fibrella aestuarina BUZ 2]|uniref:Uncharacterized protein n=1 Tax=Fibrella aestuarina BUZ 2 TaxID=1166018 RepID=I0KHG1_9BACT|nr:hypothetical protein FAES_pFAES01070 [Fibrella aestuarina BUZ 2]
MGTESILFLEAHKTGEKLWLLTGFGINDRFTFFKPS